MMWPSYPALRSRSANRQNLRPREVKIMDKPAICGPKAEL